MYTVEEKLNEALKTDFDRLNEGFIREAEESIMCGFTECYAPLVATLVRQLWALYCLNN